LLRAVPRERVHFVVLDDLVADPAVVWARLLDFCGLDHRFTPEFQDANPSTKIFRSAALHRVTHRPPTALAPAMTQFRQWSRTNPIAHRLKDGMYRNAPRPRVPVDVRRDLVEYFAADVELLGTLVGRDLGAWQADPRP
jgi:hypothetical protein